MNEVLASIRNLPNQLEQAWAEVGTLEIPQAYKNSQNIVLVGMGGSALGGRIVDSLIVDRLNTPMEVFTEYHLPNYVNSNTLLITSSYSGNTEETLSATKEAMAKKAKIFGITTGGKLAELLKVKKLPSYIFEPKQNPSGQPRMGLGYSISAILALLKKCGFISFGDEEFSSLAWQLKQKLLSFDPETPEKENLAKATASRLKGKIPILVASEHLVGIAHAFKNQLNETAKTFAVSFDLPELNHHLMEGLRNPAQAKNYLHFLLLESRLYDPQIKKRYEVTKEVINKNDIESSKFVLMSDKKSDQIFEVLAFSSFVSLYLAQVYDIDPVKIPWVDYFKKRLST
jgi:glucose/mannose-6-phosphate isomerase